MHYPEWTYHWTKIFFFSIRVVLEDRCFISELRLDSNEVSCILSLIDSIYPFMSSVLIMRKVVLLIKILFFAHFIRWMKELHFHQDPLKKIIASNFTIFYLFLQFVLYSLLFSSSLMVWISVARHSEFLLCTLLKIWSFMLIQLVHSTSSLWFFGAIEQSAICWF